MKTIIFLVSLLGITALVAQDNIKTSCDQNKDQNACEQYEGCAWYKYKEMNGEKPIDKEACSGTLIRIKPYIPKKEKEDLSKN